MRSFGRLLLTSLFVLGCSAAPARGSTITWTFAGTVGSPLLPEIPLGTLVTVDWTFDPNAANACAGTAAGLYWGQNVTVQFASTVGTLTYQSSNGFLLSGTNLVTGCTNVTLPDMELRLPTWTGPNLSTASLLSVPLQFPPGLVWSDSTLQGALPQWQPQMVFFRMQPFETASGLVTLSGPLTAVPEPSTWLLLGTGLATLAARRFTRRNRVFVH